MLQQRNISKALTLDPDNRFVLTQYGTILTLSPEPEKGIEMLERVLKLDDQFHYAWDRLASARKSKMTYQCPQSDTLAIKISPVMLHILYKRQTF